MLLKMSIFLILVLCTGDSCLENSNSVVKCYSNIQTAFAINAPIRADSGLALCGDDSSIKNKYTY